MNKTNKTYQGWKDSLHSGRPTPRGNDDIKSLAAQQVLSGRLTQIGSHPFF